MVSTQSTLQGSRIPLLIGISGHRDIADPGVVASSLENVFREIDILLPHTPILLVSALAEGADRLFVKVGQKVFSKRAGWIAVLPFPQEEYEKDFSEELSRNEFRTLIADAVQVVVAGPDVDPLKHRDEGYRRASDKVVELSSILVALWDGRVPKRNGKRLVGGTADTVDTCLKRRREPAATLLEPPRTIPVVQIVSPRVSPKGEEFADCLDMEDRNAGVVVVHFPPTDADGTSESAKPCSAGRPGWLLPRLDGDSRGFGSILRYVERFNRRVRADDSDWVKAVGKSREYLGLGADIMDIPPLRDWVLRYSVCDALACKTQVQHKQALNLLFGLSLLAGVMAQIYGGIAASRLVLAGYLVGMLTAYAVYALLIDRLLLDKTYEDARALAEALRVQVFWRLAGITDRVSDHYIRRQRGELEWIRIALRNWESLPAARSPAAPPLFDTVRKVWVDGQRDYFQRKIGGQRALDSRAARAAALCYWASVVVALLIVSALGGVLGLEKYGGFWVGIGPFFMAVIGYYRDRKAWNDTAESYARAGRAFAEASNRLAEVETPAESVELLRALGLEALRESGDWLLLHRKRPPEPMR